MRSTWFSHLGAVAVLGVFMLFNQAALAGSYQLDTDDNGLALKGHDPVAYFEQGVPTPGTADYSASHGGATYQFASAANRDLFVADPDKYAPAYGGYCAFGTTMKMKIPGDPQAWKIVDGQLYINSSPQVQTRWSEDIPGNIHKADTVWPQIQDANPADL